MLYRSNNIKTSDKVNRNNTKKYNTDINDCVDFRTKKTPIQN